MPDAKLIFEGAGNYGGLLFHCLCGRQFDAVQLYNLQCPFCHEYYGILGAVDAINAAIRREEG